MMRRRPTATLVRAQHGDLLDPHRPQPRRRPHARGAGLGYFGLTPGLQRVHASPSRSPTSSARCSPTRRSAPPSSRSSPSCWRRARSARRSSLASTLLHGDPRVARRRSRRCSSSAPGSSSRCSPAASSPTPTDQLAVGLSRVLFPIVLILGLNGLVVGILQAYDHFTIPALSPLVWNVVIMVFLVVRAAAVHGDEQLYAYAIGILVGTVVQFAMALPVLQDRRLPLRVVLRLARPARQARLHADAAGDARPRAHQLQRLRQLDPRRATSPTEAPRAIDAAFRIYMLPQGMFSVAIATVLFPQLSRLAARRDLAGLRAHGRQRPAPDLPDAAARDGGDARPRRADHAPGLPARRVRRRRHGARRHRAVLVLVQPAVQRRQPAAHAHVLQPAEALDW